MYNVYRVFCYMYNILQYELFKNKIRASPGNLEVKTSHSRVGGVDAIPGRGTKIPQALQPKNQNIKQKQYYNKFNAAAKSLQSCPTLCDPRDSLLPGSSVPGILQARTLEWVAISFSNA